MSFPVRVAALLQCEMESRGTAVEAGDPKCEPNPQLCVGVAMGIPHVNFELCAQTRNCLEDRQTHASHLSAA